jgi:hypothetical protein
MKKPGIKIPIPGGIIETMKKLILRRHFCA